MSFKHFKSFLEEKTLCKLILFEEALPLNYKLFLPVFIKYTKMNSINLAQEIAKQKYKCT